MESNSPNNPGTPSSAGRGYFLRSTTQKQQPGHPLSSRSSLSSKAASIKKIGIERQGAEKIRDLKKQTLDMKKKMDLAFSKLARLTKRKEALEKKLAEGDQTEETSSKIAALEEEIFTVEEEAEESKILYENMLAMEEEEIKVINIQTAEENEKCDSDQELDEDFLGGETVTNNMVSDWIANDNVVTGDQKDEKKDLSTPESKPVNNEEVLRTTPVQRPPAPGKQYNNVTFDENPQTRVQGTFEGYEDYGHRMRPRPYRPYQAVPSTPTNFVEDLTSALKGAFGKRGGYRDKLDRDLYPFNGKPEDWATFKNEFDRTTAEGEYTHSQNMIRIRKALSGIAMETVKHLYPVPANVPKVIEILGQRFGQPKQVLDSLVKQVKECPSPNTAKPDTVIKFGIAIEALVANIESLKKTAYFTAVDILDTVVKKLPPDLFRQWYEWIDRNKVEEDLREFSKFFSKEMSIAFKRGESLPVTEDPTARHGRHRHFGATVAAVQHEETDKKKVFCNNCQIDGHHIASCRRFIKMSPEVKKEVVEKKSLCWKCLNRGHRKYQCKSEEKCKVKGCTYTGHHTLLHDVSFAKPASEEEKKKDTSGAATTNKDETPPPVKKVGYVRKNEDLLWYIPVRVRGSNGKEKRVHAMIDTGAQPTLIEEWLAKDLGLHGPEEKIQLEWYNGQTYTEKSKIVQFQISGDFRNAKMYPLEEVNTVTNLDFPAQSYNVRELKQTYPYLQAAPLQSLDNAKPAILIGAKNWSISVSREILESDPHSPAAVKTRLGWTVVGPGGNSKTASRGFHSVLGAIRVKSDNIDAVMKSFIEDDNFGIEKKVDGNPRSREDKQALKVLEKSSIKENNRWTTGLLWKNEETTLPESKTMALKRLLMIETKADKKPEYAELLQSRFKDYIEKGYLQKVDPSESARRWYLPYFFALHPEKKPRLVFDAAAKSRGKSFNDFLLTGPDLLQPLASVLMRFRRHQIAVTGDITAMFHQVSLKKEDQPAQTILYRGMDRNKDPDEYQMTVLFFGSASSPTSAIYCKDRNAKEFEEKYPVSVNAIIKDTYMDDFLSGAETESDAMKLQKEVTIIHCAGGFPIGKWRSSSLEVLKEIPVDLRAVGDQQLSSKNDLGIEKTLGVVWDQNNDEFRFSVNLRKIPAEVQHGKRNPTKRELASFLMSLFDPLGFITPLKVKGLVILQQCWKLDLDWDERVPDSVFESWKVWFEELKSIEHITIPRSYSLSSIFNGKVQLHIFCDASQEAYSSVSFLRIQTGVSVEVSFVFGRGRVAPKKGLSIPRMELNAALMGARMKNTVQKYLDDIVFDKVYLWSDSQCVMCWIASETGRFQQYVSNRLEEILEYSTSSEWKWVPTEDNVADDATRSSKEIIMSSESRWLKGSRFLLNEPSSWPSQDRIPIAEENDLEKKKAIAVVSAAKSFLRLPLPDAERFSTWESLIFKTFKWIESCRKIQGRKMNEKDRKEILEIHRVMFAAETLWLKQAQNDCFVEDINRLQQQKNLHKSSKLYELNPAFNSEGLLVVTGRLKKAKIPAAIKFPIILDGKHRYVQLLIMKIHEDFHHTGMEAVINELRRKFWILHLRTVVKKCLRDCQKCKNERLKPIPPQMGPLPDCRLASNKPAFTHTGVDLFGPFDVAIGRRTEKRWGILLTCMTTRGVYIDLVPSLSSDDVINAIIRFSSRRGPPTDLYSDQGTNFKGANKELREFWKSYEAHYKSFRQIQWHFNCPAASHMGGSWERMIGLTKTILANVMKEKKPKEYTLLTYLAEAENVLNSRPLYFVSEDPQDEEAITPNHLLKMSCFDLGLGRLDPSDNGQKMWRHVQRYSDDFWKKWTGRVLPLLNKASKWHVSSQTIQEGDIVVVVDDQAPRNKWKKATVTKLFPGKDGVVRVVEIRMPIIKEDGKVTFGMYRRPVHKICKMDVKKRSAPEPIGLSFNDKIKNPMEVSTGENAIEDFKEDNLGKT